MALFPILSLSSSLLLPSLLTSFSFSLPLSSSSAYIPCFFSILLITPPPLPSSPFIILTTTLSPHIFLLLPPSVHSSSHPPAGHGSPVIKCVLARCGDSREPQSWTELISTTRPPLIIMEWKASSVTHHAYTSPIFTYIHTRDTSEKQWAVHVETVTHTYQRGNKLLI